MTFASIASHHLFSSVQPASWYVRYFALTASKAASFSSRVRDGSSATVSSSVAASFAIAKLRATVGSRLSQWSSEER